MTLDLRKALRAAIDAAHTAGDMLLREMHRPGGPRGPMGSALVDTLVEDLLRERLGPVDPTWGLRGEERPELNRDPQAPDGPAWLLDPNDGTRAFQRGHRGASISIGLVHNGLPVLGIVFAYAAPDGYGDLFAWAEGCGPATRNGEPLPTHPWAPSVGAGDVVLVSRSADKRAAAYQRTIAPAHYMPAPGIAYRLALAAAGEGQVAISLAGARDFDLAGGHALIRGVGGVLLDERGRPVRYHPSRPTRVGFCFGGAPSAALTLAQHDWVAVFTATVITAEERAGWPVRPRIDRLVSDRDLLRRAQRMWLGCIAADTANAQRPPSTELVTMMRFARDLVYGRVGCPETPSGLLALPCALATVRAGASSEGPVGVIQRALTADPNISPLTDHRLEAGLQCLERPVSAFVRRQLLTGRTGVVEHPEARDAWTTDAELLPEQLVSLSNEAKT